MSPPILTMSTSKFERAVLLRKVHEKRLTRAKAAEILGLSLRQVERLCRRYRQAGPAALALRRRGQPSNHQLARALRESVLELVRARCADFGPTLALEKLVECHGLVVSKETLRKWVTEDGLCKLMELFFCDAESTFNHFDATCKYLGNHGKPLAFYSDKAAVFRVNRPEPHGGDGVTQLGRALSDLNIDIIWPNSAPAKGRVERANLTLQDRLVKELRLNGISSVDAANAFAPGFVADYNARFSKAPRNGFDARRPVLATENLDDIFTWQETRQVSQSLTFNYRRQLFLLEHTEATRTLADKRLTVYELNDGTVQIRHDGKVLAMTSFAKEEAQITQGAIVSNKLLSGVLQQFKDKQATKEPENLAKARTKRYKRLLLQRIKATGESPNPTSLLCWIPDISTLP